jgi:hypothetical protein
MDVILVREKRNLDDDENGIFLQNIDIDGLQIVEKNGENMVYIYYSEIDKLIKKLRYFKRKYYDRKK